MPKFVQRALAGVAAASRSHLRSRLLCASGAVQRASVGGDARAVRAHDAHLLLRPLSDRPVRRRQRVRCAVLCGAVLCECTAYAISAHIISSRPQYDIYLKFSYFVSTWTVCLEELHSPLEVELSQLSNVKLVRGAKRLGGLRARIEALKHATAPVRWQSYIIVQ